MKQKSPKHQNKIVLRIAKCAKSGLFSAMKSIHQQDNSGKTSTTIHSHDFYELAIVVYGDGFLCINNKKIPLRRGQAFLTPPGKNHFYAEFSQIVLQNYFISKKALNLLRKPLATLPQCLDIFKCPPIESIRNLGGSEIAELDLLLNNIALENLQFSPEKELLLLSYLGQLLSKVLVTSGKESAPVYANGNIEVAIAHMQQNYQKNLRLCSLAKLANMSVSAFIQQFRQEFNMPPMRWLLELRIHHAKRLLMQLNWTIADVASACGFKDPLYFTRQFRKHLGCTPSMYRNHGQGRIQIWNRKEHFNVESFLYPH